MTDEEYEELFGKPLRHDSFATISASHVSGNARLFMSPHRHMHFVSIKITRAHVARNLSEDRVYGGGEVIAEVDMSAAQWAHFIGAPNQGNGSPCTLKYYRDGDLKRADEPPESVGTRETFSKELREHAAKALAGVRSALGAIDKMLAPNGTFNKGNLREIRDALSKAMSNDIDAGLGFTLQQGEEWLDKMVEQAKSEIEAHQLAGIRGIAMEAIAAEMDPEAKERLRANMAKLIADKTEES